MKNVCVNLFLATPFLAVVAFLVISFGTWQTIKVLLAAWLALPIYVLWFWLAQKLLEDK